MQRVKWQSKYRAKQRKNSHFIFLRLGERSGEPKSNIIFFLDNKKYAELEQWADKRFPLRPAQGRVSWAMRVMIVAAARVPREDYGKGLILAFDAWRAQKGFKTRPAAMRWLISEMIARDAR